MTTGDRSILRELARDYLDICASPVQAERRDLWRRHNSLEQTRPLIYVRAFAWREMPQARSLCQDPLCRQFEDYFRYCLFWNSLEDDSIFEPWVTVRAARKSTGWGVDWEKRFSTQPHGAFKVAYPIIEPDDINKLKLPTHVIDEEQTRKDVEQLGEAIGDLITIDVDRAPAFGSEARYDIATDLGYLRGIENFMVDMIDRPGWLHGLVGFLANGLAATYDAGETLGHWSRSPHAYSNQAMPYSKELADPAANAAPAERRQLWVFMAAQEFTGVSPAMHEDFLLQYQLPIMEQFGLSAYGCCEDLTNKIEMLRQIPNLRRLAVAPSADVGRCAEQIGRDYVLSYRPSPADMVSYGFDPDRISDILRRDLSACRNSHVDITLKDVETVEGDPDRVRQWVTLCRQVIDEVFG
jgi:hypothetical protein